MAWEWMSPIIVALIAGPVMYLITRFDKNNSVQHAENKKVLERIEDKIDVVGDRLSNHIDWHLENSDNH